MPVKAFNKVMITMKKTLLILLAGAAGLVLVAVAALAVLLASFTPDDYKGLIAGAVEKSTGRQAIFKGDISLNFFPEIRLKTGDVLIQDSETFGGGDLLSVEDLSLALALKPLLSGNVEIVEIILSGARLNLKVDAQGRRNWEELSAKPDPAPGKEEEKDKSLALRVERIACSNLALSYQDQRSKDDYSLLINEFAVSGWPDKTMIPILLSGDARDEKNLRKASFQLKARAGLNMGDPASLFSLDIEDLEISAQAQDIAPMHLKSAGNVEIFSAARWSLKNLKGNLSSPAEGAYPALSADFSGQAASSAQKDSPRPLLEGELTFASLDLDRIVQILDRQGEVKSGEPKGAPNLAKASVAGKSAPKTGSTPPPAPAARRAPENTVPNLDANLHLAAQRLILRKIPLNGLKVDVKMRAGQIDAPYSFKMFQGGISGRAGLDLRTSVPAFSLTAAVQGLDLLEMSAALVDKYQISGKLKASIDLKGKGQNSPSILHSLLGKASVFAGPGEVRGFKLIPGDLPGFNKLPETFSYQSISASASIDKGAALTRDISLQAPLLTAKGGGTLHIAYGQMDLGIDFMAGGLPPAVPIGIHGPLNSLSYEVDMRTFLRNTAESAVNAPKSAVDAVKGLGDRLLRKK
ncbi:MAG: AsmA family protein [Desulfovibrio sp.]|nr:AsmA family protein [Desulfovibrio sp.]